MRQEEMTRFFERIPESESILICCADGTSLTGTVTEKCPDPLRVYFGDRLVYRLGDCWVIDPPAADDGAADPIPITSAFSA